MDHVWMGEPMVWGTPVHLISRDIIQTARFFDPARELVLEQIHHFRKKVLLSVAWLEKIRWGTTTQESGHFCIEPFLKHSILGPSTVSLCTQIKAQQPTYPFWNFVAPTSWEIGDHGNARCWREIRPSWEPTMRNTPMACRRSSAPGWWSISMTSWHHFRQDTLW